MNEASLEYNKGYFVSQLEHLEKENLQIKKENSQIRKENNHLVENYFQNIEFAVEQIIKIFSENSNNLQNISDDFIKNKEYKK